MSKRFFYTYEDPSYEDGLDDFNPDEYADAMEDMPEEPLLTEEDLDNMEKFYNQRFKEQNNA
jgi:hypothetical protein